MRKYLPLVALSFSSFMSYGQSSKFTFKLGTEYDLPRKTEDLAFFGNEKDGIVNLSLKKEELIIVRFNTKTLDKTIEKKIDLQEASKNFNSEMVADFNNHNYFWIHSDWDKDSEAEILYYDKIDVNTGKISEANHKMFQTTKLAGDAELRNIFYSYKKTNKYEYNYDAARKKLLVSYRLSPDERNDKKNYDKLGFQVFDENLKKVWGGEFTMPYTEAVMDNSDFSVDAKGNAYLLAKVYDSDARRERDKTTGKPGYHFEIMRFNGDSKKPTIIPISVNDYYIRETSLTENSSHEMIVACTYSKKSKGSGTDGVFLATINESGKLAQFKNGYYEFPVAELEKFEKARNKRKMERKDDYEAPNLKVRDILTEDDGSIFITCEEYYLVAHQHYDASGRSSRTTYTYNYDDIIASKISAAGKFEWLRKIPKRQEGTRGRGTMSFKFIGDATGYYFLYLDNIKNLNLEEDEVPKRHADGFGGQVIVSKISKDGVHTKELLFDTRDEDIMIFPADFYQINRNQFIGRARLKKNLFQPLLITSK